MSSWWGKLAGGAFGFMLGGPLGAILGAAVGHNFDRGLDQVKSLDGERVVDTERTQSAFFTATFSIMGHIAKSDGTVTPHEIQMARNIMANMNLNADQEALAIRLFNEGKAEGFPLNAVLHQFREVCHSDWNLVQMFIEIQIETILADQEIHKDERKLLYHIGHELGFDALHIDQLISMVQAQARYAHHDNINREAYISNELTDAYSILGVSSDSGNDEVKTAYRRLMSQHHPDKLVSKGLPDEMMKMATAKTQEIKHAYEKIISARKSTETQSTSH